MERLADWLTDWVIMGGHSRTAGLISSSLRFFFPRFLVLEVGPVVHPQSFPSMVTKPPPSPEPETLPWLAPQPLGLSGGSSSMLAPVWPGRGPGPLRLVPRPIVPVSPHRCSHRISMQPRLDTM